LKKPGSGQRLAAIGAGLAGIVLASASLAWACSAQANIFVNPPAAPAGTTVTVSGGQFLPGPVEIHWNSTAGPVVGTTTGPDFSTAVQIPANAPPDVYTLVATSGNFLARTPFEVTTATANGGNGTKSGTTTGAASGDTSPQTTVKSQTASFPAGPSENATSGQSEAVNSGAGGNSASDGPSSGSRPNTSHGTSTAASQPTEPGVISRQTTSLPVTPVFPPVPDQSSRQVSADLWSGFVHSSAGALGSVPGPVQSGLGGNMAVGMGLSALALGLMSVAGGFAAAEARRRTKSLVSGG